jgi:hypothetical protein
MFKCFFGFHTWEIKSFCDYFDSSYGGNMPSRIEWLECKECKKVKKRSMYGFKAKGS